MSEQDKANKDLIQYGQSFTVGGKHIPLDEVILSKSEQDRIAFEKWFVESIGELKYPESEPAILAKHNAKAGWNAATTEANKRIEALEGEVALARSNEAHADDQRIKCIRKYKNQVAELQASNKDLREALQEVKKWFDSNIELEQSNEYGDLEPANSYSYECYQFVCFINQALSATPPESLQAFENEVIKRWLCKIYPKSEG